MGCKLKQQQQQKLRTLIHVRFEGKNMNLYNIYKL